MPTKVKYEPPMGEWHMLMYPVCRDYRNHEYMTKHKLVSASERHTGGLDEALRLPATHDR